MRIDSNGQISVKIMNEDIDTGLLSVRVEEKFIHPNGNTGKVTAERTVILADVPEDPIELCTVKFYISQGDSKVYKKCVVAKGDYLTAPVTPYLEGKQFIEWESVAGTDLSIPGSNNRKPSIYDRIDWWLFYGGGKYMKKSKKSVLLCLLMVCVLLTGCGSVYESSQSGYTKVNSISGAVFDMPEQFLSQSMMISTISKD